jgi:hypothetical protein
MSKDLVDEALAAWNIIKDRIIDSGWTRERYVGAFLNAYLPKTYITVSAGHTIHIKNFDNPGLKLTPHCTCGTTIQCQIPEHLDVR